MDRNEWGFRKPKTYQTSKLSIHDSFNGLVEHEIPQGFHRHVKRTESIAQAIAAHQAKPIQCVPWVTTREPGPNFNKINLVGVPLRHE